LRTSPTSSGSDHTTGSRNIKQEVVSKVQKMDRYASFRLIMGPFKGEVFVFATLWPVRVRVRVVLRLGQYGRPFEQQLGFLSTMVHGFAVSTKSTSWLEFCLRPHWEDFKGKRRERTQRRGNLARLDPRSVWAGSMPMLFS